MSSFFGNFLLCFSVALSAAQETRFPLCSRVVEVFGRRGVNLFSDGEDVFGIQSIECLEEIAGPQQEWRLRRLYYCAGHLTDKDGTSIVLEFDRINEIGDNHDIFCSNFGLKPNPPPPFIPPSTLSCPLNSVPTMRSQFESDTQLCAATCSYPVRNRASGVYSTNTRSILLCCAGDKLTQNLGRYTGFRFFSFIRRPLATCEPEV